MLKAVFVEADVDDKHVTSSINDALMKYENEDTEVYYDIVLQDPRPDSKKQLYSLVIEVSDREI